MDSADELDQFYTKPDVARVCIKKLFEVVDESRRLIFIEPSSGCGSFSNNLSNCVSIDVDPKTDSAIRADFLNLSPADLPIRPESSVVVIGNPPFGKMANMAVKFFNHATFFGQIIAFIVPKTFKKESVKNRLNLNYHLIFEYEVPKRSFIFRNTEHNVPCVFQIWEKREEKRKISKPKENPYFVFVKQEGADFAIRRVGGRTGKVVRDFMSVSKSSHYFIKARRVTPNTLERLFSQMDFSSYIDSTAGIRSLSKAEILREAEFFITKQGISNVESKNQEPTQG